ncbi:hypothetical protein HDA42_003655 [Streptomyces costaricanus]|uniref:Nucleotidyltransferase family protein n=1 Tax=Streptomyces murinus TaxID=33900 RepID=A0A7W3RLS4_STRMR|nr:hypothetical protein [Streptomyces murinus]
MAGRLSGGEQERLREVLGRNEVLVEVLGRAAGMRLPGWYLTAGCLFQTVWNVVTGRPPGRGIKDYDLFYFDDTDLSWEAEDAVIRAGREVFALPAGAPPPTLVLPRPLRQPGPGRPLLPAAQRGAGAPALRRVNFPAGSACSAPAGRAAPPPSPV